MQRRRILVNMSRSAFPGAWIIIIAFCMASCGCTGNSHDGDVTPAPTPVGEMNLTSLLDLAIEAFNGEDFVASLSIARQAVTVDQHNATAWSLVGLSRDRLGDQQGALEAYNSSLALNSQNAYIWTQKGDLFYTMGRFAAAADCSETALRIAPGYQDALALKEKAIAAIGVPPATTATATPANTGSGSYLISINYPGKWRLEYGDALVTQSRGGIGGDEVLVDDPQRFLKVQGFKTDGNYDAALYLEIRQNGAILKSARASGLHGSCSILIELT